jgi:hypothetical protein
MSVMFEIFESDVMKMLASRKNEIAPLLLAQYAQAKITSREFSGRGFFSEFSIDNPELKIPGSFEITHLGCSGKIDGIKSGVGFVLFLKNGFINTLEGYINGDEEWVDEINEYRLF